MDYALREFLEFTAADDRADTEQLVLAYLDRGKSTWIAYVLFFLLFPMGAHRFYLGLSRSALIVPSLYFLTAILLSLFHHLNAPEPLLLLPIGIGLAIPALWLWDLAFLSNWVYEHNRALLHRLNAELLRKSVSDLSATD